MGQSILEHKKKFVDALQQQSEREEINNFDNDLPGGSYGSSIVDVALAGPATKDELFRMKAVEATLEVLKKFGPTNVKAIEELYDLFYNKLTKKDGTRQELR